MADDALRISGVAAERSKTGQEVLGALAFFAEWEGEFKGSAQDLGQSTTFVDFD